MKDVVQQKLDEGEIAQSPDAGCWILVTDDY
jgi:hypothetical protein